MKLLQTADVRAEKKLTQKFQVRSLIAQGMYMHEARTLVQSLVAAGCSQHQVANILKTTASTFGISLKQSMSRCTMCRAIIEGGVAAKVQLGYEISHTQSKSTCCIERLHHLLITHIDLTRSGDGTSHRHTNFESRHIALPAESYGSLPDSASTTIKAPHNCLMGVNTSINHTSQAQFEGWKSKISKVSDMYSQSPLATWDGSSLTPDLFAIKMHGVSGDHTNDQKWTIELLHGWKVESQLVLLGADALLAQKWDEIEATLDHASKEKMDSCGGPLTWDALPLEDQAAQDVAMMRELSIQLGKEVFAKLPLQEQETLKMLIWAGCCMHKELNSVKGGTKAMEGVWAKFGLDAPVLLANKDNDAVLQLSALGTAVWNGWIRFRRPRLGPIDALTLIGCHPTQREVLGILDSPLSCGM